MKMGALDGSLRDVRRSLARRLLAGILLLTVCFDTAAARAQEVDQDPPTIHTISPLDGAIVTTTLPAISAGFADEAQGAGVIPEETVLLVDSVVRTSEALHDDYELSWTPTAALEDGIHQISLYVEDAAGNGTTRNWSFIVDTIPPQLEIAPFPDPFPSQSSVIEATAYYSDAGSGLNVQSFNMAFGIGIEGLPSCERGPESANCISPPLKSGAHTVTASIRDLAGRLTTVATTLNLIVDTKGPEVRILSPEDGSVGNDPTIEVSGVVSDEDDEVDRVELNGIVIPLGNGTFAGETTLSEGQNLLTVVAFDRAGNSEASQVNVTLDSTAPTISDLSPADGSHVTDSTPLVSAAYSDGGVGLDLALTQLLVDLVDRTAEATVSPTGIQWTPTATLVDGHHAVELHVVDDVGNVTVSNWSFSVDTTAPSVTIDPFENPFLSDSAVVSVSLSFLDGGVGGSGIDPASLEIAIDGVPFESSCTVLTATATCLTPPLVTGTHTIVTSLADLVGNEGTDTEPLNVIVDVAAPVVEIVTPVDGSYQNTATVEISGTVVDDGPLDRVELDGEPIVLVDGAFSVQKTLEAGSNLFTVVAVDMIGRPGLDSVVVRLDTGQPVLTIDEPTEGQLSNVPTIRVTGRADDPAGIALAAVGGVPVTLTNGRFDTQVPLAEGANVILIEATDGAGNLASASRNVTYLAVPQIEILVPEDLSWIADTAIDVSGTVTAGSTVTVNDVEAVVTNDTFVAQGVPLIEGGNLVTATAISTTGAAATDHVEVVRDLTAPSLVVATPVDGEITAEAAIPVAGLVNDLVVGTVNASEVEVRVNGQLAEVANRQFLLPSLALVPGANPIVIEAEDASGNLSTAALSVERQVATGARIEMVSGNLQTGVIETALGQPLVARVLDATGMPVAGETVVFRVEGGDGSLGNGQRSQAVTTDGAGLASATFTLGEYAGAASQRVRAAAVGFGEVVFRATATPGAAVQIVADAGSQQLGTAGGSVPRPFVAAVTDAGSNRLAGVPVRFTVVKGTGHFEAGATERVVDTDSDGRAITSFVLGTDDGIANNVVVARIDGLPEGPSAAFVASGWAAGDPAATTIVGQVLDNQNEPVPGVTMRVKNDPLMRTAVADANGFFRMTNAPVGTVYLIADGSTATRPGAWADLEYVVTTVPGRENDLGRPVYLLPIDIGNGAYVSETLGGTVELEDYPGFALEIAPGSVTFPGGSRTGVISVTAVHSDRVPKTPNFGQQPQLIVTIQPAGARFDPPARMTLPNLEGLPPGTVTEMYSFDHDLSQFVAIGPATVSDDGTVITANPGVGVIKAGWHAGGDPVPTGSACNCPEGLTCIDGRCVDACSLPGAADSSFGGTCPSSCQDGNECTIGDYWDGDVCRPGTRREITSLRALANGLPLAPAYVGEVVVFGAESTGSHCEPETLEYLWDFRDGQTSTEMGPSHTFADSGMKWVALEAKCANCSTADAVAMVDVRCPQVEIVDQFPNIPYTCPGCQVHFQAQATPGTSQIFWSLPDGDLNGAANISTSGVLTISEFALSGDVTVKASVGSAESTCSATRPINVRSLPAEGRVGPFAPAELRALMKPSGAYCAVAAATAIGYCKDAQYREFPGQSSREDGSMGNAFLHACMNCASARRCPGGTAEDFWTGHEEYATNSCPHFSMDYHNNAIGRDLAFGASDCAAAVLEAFQNGELRWMDPVPQNPPGQCPINQYRSLP